MKSPPLLILGKHGQLATAIAARAYCSGLEVTHLGRPELDANDENSARLALEPILNSAQPPGCVVNTIAYTAVDLAETEQDAATQINHGFVNEVARICDKHQQRLIHVSTDYVFDGRTQRPYRETDPANPLNIYGQSKLRGERSVLSRGAPAIILRTSWLTSEHGRNFLTIMSEKALSGLRVNVVSDQVGSPTSANDLAHTIIQIAGREVWPARAQLFHAAGNRAMSWFDYARLIYRANNADESLVAAIPSSAYSAAAERPKFSTLESAAFFEQFQFTEFDVVTATERDVKAWRERRQ